VTEFLLVNAPISVRCAVTWHNCPSFDQ